MRLRNFSAATMDEAMRRVRQELGEDAIILSTRRDGKHGVLVTAGLEDEPLAAEEVAADEAPSAELPRADSNALEGLDRIAARLEFNSVPAAIADRLLNAAAELSTENPTLALAAALDAQFAFAPLIDDVPERPLLFVGPPGVGKTSSLAKLAIRARLAGVAVGAVTCDMLRAGAEAQLATYTSRLDIPAYRARDGQALARALASLPVEGLRLIDSAGSNPQSETDLADAASLAAIGNAEPILVLAAGGDPAETADQARIYARLGARRLIVTKLDTVRRLGGLLAAAAAGGLALCEFGLSPQISDGLVPMNPVSLARLLMGERIELPSLYPAAKEAAE
jgi:flagellar biosynthesis protein FlhF